MENTFIEQPPCINIFNPYKGKTIARYVFVGCVPAAVKSALRHADKLSANEKKTLKEFYGDNWCRCLHFDRTGGATDDNATDDPLRGLSEQINLDLEDIRIDVDELDEQLRDIDETIDEEIIAPTITEATNLEISHTSGTHYIFDVHIFPEDTIMDIRMKIFAAIGIPPYRQYLYSVYQDQVKNFHKIYLAGVYIPADIRQQADGDSLLGLPIDKSLYDDKEDITIDAYDAFTTAASIPEGRIGRLELYCVDLATITTSKSQIEAIFSNVYQTELLYYGIIMKFWPQLSFEMFKQVILNENQMFQKYPDIAPSKSQVMTRLNMERELIVEKYSKIETATGWAEKSTTVNIYTLITHAVMRPKVRKYPANLRNIFDFFQLSKVVPEIRLATEHNGKSYMLKKTHIVPETSIVFSSVLRNVLCMAISLHEEDQRRHHIATKLSTIENEQVKYLYLYIYPDGGYAVKSYHQEASQETFESVEKLLLRHVNSVLKNINELGAKVFQLGGRLELISRQNISYDNINMSFIWKRSLSDSSFRIVKKQFTDYINAGLARSRTIQNLQSNYELVWSKGMTDFNLDVIKNVLQYGTSYVMTNMYAWLSNNIVKQKWEHVYGGRIVRLHHRTTDIKLDVVNISIDEFAVFRDYVYVLFYGFHRNKEMRAATGQQVTQSVKKQRESDPELYDLKRHGSDKIYSRICQAENQPEYYTRAEYEDLSEKEKKKLTKWWNFTLNQHAWYGCPNATYPHLSFKVGIHPKGYCLPCCDKGAAVPDSVKAKNREKCLRDYSLTDVVDTRAAQQHVLSFGKSIPPGRMSKIPGETLRKLFMPFLLEDKTKGLYVYGVDQQIGAISAGIVYIIAMVLDESPDAIISRIIDKARHTPIESILGGALLEYYQSGPQLADGLQRLLRQGAAIGPEVLFQRWNEVFIELLDENILPLIFYHKDTQMTINAGKPINKNFQYVILVQFSGEIYPIVYVDPKVYPVVDFKAVWDCSDTPVVIIDKLISSFAKTGINTYQGIKDKYKVIKKYVNRHGRIYGVQLKAGFRPCQQIDDIRDNVPAEHNYWSVDDLMTKLPAGIKPEKIYQSQSGSNLISIVLADGLYYPIAGDIAGEKTTLPFDILKINKIIAEKTPPEPDRRDSLTTEALYRNNIYGLFVNEFIYYISRERDNALRKKLIALIEESDFKSDFSGFQKRLRSLTKHMTHDDVVLLLKQIESSGYLQSQKKCIVEKIRDTTYDFDKTTIREILACDDEQAVECLKKVAARFTTIGEVTEFSFTNIYLPCAESSAEYCRGGKLVVRESQFDVLIKTLVGDIRNEIKLKFLLSAGTFGNVIEFFKFEHRPAEIISIKQV